MYQYTERYSKGGQLATYRRHDLRKMQYSYRAVDSAVIKPYKRVVCYAHTLSIKVLRVRKSKNCKISTDSWNEWAVWNSEKQPIPVAGVVAVGVGIIIDGPYPQI